MDQFQHTDGRFFRHIGTTPHATRDGRMVTLNVWETNCSHKDCTAVITVKTATDSPDTWKNFEPKKYCRKHRNEALYKHRVSNAFAKARADGLKRWMASDEGKAAIKERERNKLGRVDRALYNAICDLSLTEERILWEDAKQSAIDRLPPPPKEGQRDTRKYRVSRSLMHLVLKGFVQHTDGVIVILR